MKIRKGVTAMKKHEIKEKNYYYFMADLHQRYIGQVKPGTSQQKKVNDRTNSVHYYEPNMTPMCFLTIYNTSKARLEAMEHEIKADLFEAGMAHYGNDHFAFKFARKGSRKAQYFLLACIVMVKAEIYCDKHNLKYELTWLN